MRRQRRGKRIRVGVVGVVAVAAGAAAAAAAATAAQVVPKTKRLVLVLKKTQLRPLFFTRLARLTEMRS